MRVLIPTIMYGRHKTFDIFAQGVFNLRKAFPRVQIDVLVVGSGDEEAAQKHGFEYYDFPNQPLSEKAQYRLSLCKDRADYYLFMGSDDIMDAELFQHYLNKMKDGLDLIACYDIYLYSRGMMYYSKGYPSDSSRFGEALAVGRCCSNKLLGEHDWELWTEERKIGLDGKVWQKLKDTKRKHIFYSKHVGILLDVKTNENIGKINQVRHTELGHAEDWLDENIVLLLDEL